MAVLKRAVQRVVKLNSSQQVNNRVVFPGDGGVGYENGIHIDFETGLFYTKAPGQDANVKTRIQDLFTFTGDNKSKYLGSAGLLISSQTNTPRIAYNINGTVLGMLMEPSRTNLCLQSETLDNASWTKTASSITANAIASPDGATTADKIVEDGTTAIHLISQSIAFTSGTTYAASVYFKAGERTWGFVQLPSAAFTTNTSAYFNLSTGTVGTTSNSPTTAVEQLPNGWYRCTIIKAATVTTSGVLTVSTASADNTNSYAGNSTSGIYAWGIQVEASAYPTSYIPTVAATVTRAADSCVLGSTTNLFNTAVGTVQVVCNFAPNAGAEQTRKYFFSVGTGSAVLEALPAGGSNFTAAISDGTTEFGSGQNFTMSSTKQKFGSSYNSAGMFAVNNALNSNGSTAFDGNMNSGGTAAFGMRSDGTGQITGCILKGHYWPEKLSISQVQTLTT